MKPRSMEEALFIADLWLYLWLAAEKRVDSQTKKKEVNE